MFAFQMRTGSADHCLMNMNVHADNTFSDFLQAEQRLIARVRNDRNLQASLAAIRGELLPCVIQSPAKAFDRRLIALLWPDSVPESDMK